MPNQADQKQRKPTTQKVRAGSKNVVSHDHHDGKKRSQGMGGAKASKRAHKRLNEGSGSRQVERKKKRPVHDSAIHGVNFSMLQMKTLKKYKKKYELSQETNNKQELVEVVSEHFRRQEVVEIDTIILFSHMVKKNKEKEGQH